MVVKQGEKDLHWSMGGYASRQTFLEEYFLQVEDRLILFILIECTLFDELPNIKDLF